MAVPLERFIKQLEDSGILAGDTLNDFLPPKSDPKDAEELARELVRQRKLTKFQAEEIYRGRAKSLLLGNYVLMEKIGAGGMGQVFKAEHRRMKRVVAIKLLPTAMTKDESAIARFEREVEAAARLRHSNIVAADDADCANGVHFLVMELVEGSDLSALVKKNGPFPVAKAVNYILQAAKGLEFAHNEGVVHRDIKPANLLLDKKGTVKILDMGLARLNGEADAPARAELTSTGTVMGTVDYMAPEQALNTKAADSRADIYALGCSLYYLLTGKATYEGDTLMAKLLAHRDQPIPSLRATFPGMSEEVDGVFQKMVAKKVQDRYQSMAEVVAALENCGSDPEQSVNLQQTHGTFSDTGLTNFLKDISVTPIGPVKKVTKPLIGHDQKKWLLIGGGVFCLLILLAALVGKVKTRDGTAATLVPLQEQPAMVGMKHDPIADGTKTPLAFTMPGFDQWTKDVAAMPAEQQIEAISKKLVELNPGFDGKMTGANGNLLPTIENGVVTQLGFIVQNVTDLSPVRALSGMKTLYCNGSGPGHGELADLSPLKGLRLTALTCEHVKVVDLSPLKGMPLTDLACSNTLVSDLSPLTGMSLKTLYCYLTQVSDLSPLKNMPLQFLSCEGTPVSDFAPLRDCKDLHTLRAVHTKVTPASVASLQKALPNCRIEWDGSPPARSK